MQKHSLLQSAQPGDVYFGFQLIRREHVRSKSAELYTLRHQQTGAELLYFDRPDENKTFAICFKTLPEDDTGVFHILEHSVLNGSRKYPVKEPFVSMLQSSMQTFLNALTFSDKTLYPVSSRNERDFFNLMQVYLDAVFCPSIYERPEIFMQEGWHYEFENAEAEPYYNGVVFSEMKGAYADVDRIIEDEMSRLLYPDTCYGYISGGHPAHIPDLTYLQFLDTHRRYYHPSNAKIFLDGHMDIDAALQYMDEAYLSRYHYREPDFDFVRQTPVTAKNTVFYAAREGEENLAHMSVAKILCMHQDTEKIYAARILADYLTGSNEAPLKRAFLERGLAQDVSLEVDDGIFQPGIALVIRNTEQKHFTEIKEFLPEAVHALLAEGLDREALKASLERLDFTGREISEPYGVELVIKALDGWLYGDDPLTHIETAGIFEALRAKIHTEYFEDLLREMLGNPDDKCYLYVLPSMTKGQDDAREEADRLAAITAAWDGTQRRQMLDAFVKMQQWQQCADSEEVLGTLPRLSLKDVPEVVKPTATLLSKISGTEVLEVQTETNGIVYLNLYFDISDFSLEELRMASVLTACFGELRTRSWSADALQTKIKTAMGALDAKLELISKPGDLHGCKPYLLVSASMLEEKVPEAMELLEEILIHSCYDEADKINETVQQDDYFMKQALIGNGHTFAITKSLSAFSKEGTMKELLGGESFTRWFSGLAKGYAAHKAEHSAQLAALAEKAFAGNRLFVGFGGKLPAGAIEGFLRALPVNILGECAVYPDIAGQDSVIEIPADVGFSALGHNLYALGGAFSGACSVMASLVTYGYLWNAVRVQGGAYGTGMNIRVNGDVFCYSYRDPNLKNTRDAYSGVLDFLEGFLSREESLDDIIIGTVNTTDPLLDPAGICDLACIRHLKGITHQAIARIRKEILHTSAEDIKQLSQTLRDYIENGRFCAVGSREAIALAVRT